MTSKIIASRRQVLQFLGAVLGVATVRLPFGGERCRVTDPELAAAVAQLIPDGDSAAAIGREYLRLKQQEQSAQLLQCAIRASLAEEPVSVDGLRRRIALDFERGDAVNLQGWILSRTEARLCALYVVQS